MIVIEREFLARWIREMKRGQDSENSDYYTGYMSAMSTVEGILALVPDYDLEKLAEMPHPGLFSPEEVAAAMALHAQGDTRFRAWEKIVYSPSEVRGILEDRARKGL